MVPLHLPKFKGFLCDDPNGQDICVRSAGSGVYSLEDYSQVF